jgi:hypothetical protein
MRRAPPRSAKRHRIAGQQQRHDIEHQGETIRHQSCEHPRGDTQHHGAKQPLDVIHPRTGARQPASCRCADHQQWRAHAEAHGEQRAGASAPHHRSG